MYTNSHNTIWGFEKLRKEGGQDLKIVFKITKIIHHSFIHSCFWIEHVPAEKCVMAFCSLTSFQQKLQKMKSNTIPVSYTQAWKQHNSLGITLQEYCFSLVSLSCFWELSKIIYSIFTYFKCKFLRKLHLTSRVDMCMLRNGVSLLWLLWNDLTATRTQLPRCFHLEWTCSATSDYCVPTA